MNVEIVTINDEFFTIRSKQLDEVAIATDGQRSCIGKTEKDAVAGVVEAIETSTQKAAPLENPSKGHPFDPFAGTSWEGKKQSF